jgi:hypothetical protein
MVEMGGRTRSDLERWGWSEEDQADSQNGYYNIGVHQGTIATNRTNPQTTFQKGYLITTRLSGSKVR